MRLIVLLLVAGVYLLRGRVSSHAIVRRRQAECITATGSIP
jgi:hypothetical protein